MSRLLFCKSFRAVPTAVASIALAGFFASPTLAQSPSVNLSQLAAQVAALQSTVNAQQATINSQAASITSLQNTVSSQATTISTLQSTVTALQTLTAPISIHNGVGTNTE